MKPTAQESDNMVIKAKVEMIEEKKTEDKVYDRVEQMPEFVPCTYEVPVCNKKGKKIVTTETISPESLFV